MISFYRGINITYLLIASNLIRQFMYKFNFFGNILLNVVFIIFQYIFLTQLSLFAGYDNDLSSINFNLIFVVFNISNLLLSFIIPSVNTFFYKVSLGEMEPYFAKPISRFHLLFFGWCNPSSLIMLSLFLVFTIFMLDFSFLVNISIRSSILCICSWLILMMLNCLIVIALNSITYVTGRFIPVDYIHEKVFELSIVPLSFYPGRTLRGMILLLPIALTVSIPVSFLNADHSLNHFFYLIFSSLLFSLVSYIIYKKSLLKYSGAGG